MSDGWIETTLGELLTLEYGKGLTEANRDGLGYPVYGSAGVAGRHSTPLVKEAPWIVVGRKGTAGSVIWADTPGWPIDTTYWVNLKSPDLTTEYAFLLLQAANLSAVSAQTGVPGLNRDRVYELTVKLPPLVQQRRIVDIFASIDAAIEADRTFITRTQKAVDALLGDVFTPWPESATKLGELVNMSSGPSWSASQETPEPRVGSTPVLKITNTPKAGPIDLSEVAYVQGLPASTRVLSEGDLVLIRTNGNRDRIGNVYRIGHEAAGFSYSAFQIGIRPIEGVNGDFLYWSLRAPWIQRAITGAASGTTGLGNIAISWLRELPLWVPEEEEEANLWVELFDSLQSVSNSAESQLASLVSLRRAVLGDLLSGAKEIPESYDRFLEAAS